MSEAPVFEVAGASSPAGSTCATEAQQLSTPTTFDDFALSPPLREALRNIGFVTPTPVQAAVFAQALAGRDMVVQAKTGSGKTCAFGLPLLERIAAGAGSPGAPRGLVLVPTRELAHQVATDLRQLASVKGNQVLAVYGGVPMGRQIAGLRAGADIVVGTPGRLLDHIRRGGLVLNQVEAVVLDEADEMLSMGFWDDVTDLLKLTPTLKQTMLFSATLPYQVAQAAAQFLRNPERVDLSGDDLTVAGITNCIVHVSPALPKPRQLLYLLETVQPESAIIFCNTRNEAEMIAKFLTQSGFVAEQLSGSLRQKDRERVLSRIKAGELRYMVATDVAARGIDVADLSHVFNYALPEFSEVYVHRVGRTGRIGKMGVAISLVDGRGLGTLTVLERQFGISFAENVLPAEEEILRRRSERIMRELSEKASVAEVSQHLPVAKSIVESADAPQVVAFLLKSYFNAQLNQAPERRVGAQNGAATAGEGEEASSSAGAAQLQQPQQQQQQEGQEAGGEKAAGARRKRRRRRRRRGGEKGGGEVEAGGLASGSGRGDASAAATGAGAPVASASESDGMRRIRVNIGFDDGFKGRGSVAKKISQLAGLNEGIISEVELRRDHSILKATPENAEMVVERVDGAQIGKKVLELAVLVSGT